MNNHADDPTTYPLREANVVIDEIAEKAGSYIADVRLRPWLPFDDLAAALRWEVSIPMRW